MCAAFDYFSIFHDNNLVHIFTKIIKFVSYYDTYFVF